MDTQQTQINEEWRDAVGYEGLYKVSNTGKVLSMNYFGAKGRVEQLLPSIDRYGYPQVILSRYGERKTYKIHRLVALAFIPNTNNLPCINHKDENKQNNHVDNLEWCTVKYNNTYKTNRIRAAASESIPILQFTKDGQFIREFPSAQRASEYIGLNVKTRDSHITACCKGKRNFAYGYVWRYKDESRNKLSDEIRAERKTYLSEEGLIKRKK